MFVLCILCSEPVCDIKEVKEPFPDNAAELKTQTSVTSSEPTTSESRCKSVSLCFSLTLNNILNILLECLSIAVVSLNDTDELTSAESEDEPEDEGESGDENVEDSGSEVEIIEEVKGNGRSNHPPGPALYLEELPPHEQYLQEQANAVFSLVTPGEQLKVSAFILSICSKKKSSLLFHLSYPIKIWDLRDLTWCPVLLCAGIG